MKFRISKRDILAHIQIVQKAVSSRTTKQILEGILLIAKEGTLTLQGTDTEISIITSVKCEVLEEGSIVVGSRLFGDIVRKLPDSVLNVKVTNNIMNIVCENSQFNISCQSGNEFPQIMRIPLEKSVTMSVSSLKNAIKQTIFAVSLDETRIALTGVLLDIKNTHLNFVALDGFRMSLKTMDIKSEFEEECIIPGRSLNELYKILDEEEENLTIWVSGNSIMVDLGSTQFFTVLLTEKYFQYEQLANIDHSLVVNVVREEIQSSLERAGLLAKEERTNLVKLSIEGGIIGISSNSEIGDVNETVLCQTDGSSLNIAFNSKYILDGIKNIDADKINMYFTDSVNPCIIKSEEDEGYLYLVLPVRMVG